MDGIIVVNKPQNCTSHDVVYKVKKIFNEKVGHTGTLDPMATGVLPLLIGKGTLCSKYLINHDKEYEVGLQLGKKTDTADLEGNIIEEKEVKKESISKENIQQVLNTFIGKQEQMPPMYSAIKINGKKLYEYARKGQEVEVKSRQIEIYNIELLRINEEEKCIEFKVKCSKGTYIRSLCENIAQKMGTVGYMSKLNRIQVGEFTINNSVTLEQLIENKNNDNWLKEHIITLEKFFETKQAIELNDRKLELFLNGVQLTYRNNDDIYRIYNNKKFIGTGIITNELLKRDVIL